MLVAFVALASSEAPRWARSAPDVPRRVERARPWLLVSDLHFDPFASSARIDVLAHAQARNWRRILADDRADPSGYFHDTNAALLQSALTEMRRVAPDPPVVVIAGDFLAHGFPAKFAAAQPHAASGDYETFVDKTIAYLAELFGAAYPRAQFIIALGNNDSACGDYASAPHSPFLARMANAWAPLVNRRGAAPDFVADFSDDGYYETQFTAVSGHAGEAIVLNSVPWSAKYHNACGKATDDPGGAELNWLEATIAHRAAADRWFVMHIPPGIDEFSSLLAGHPVPFLRDSFATRLRALVAGPNSHGAALIAGHLHHASFELVTAAGSGTPLAGFIVPSISPVQGSNPAFATITVDPHTQTLLDAVTYVLPLQTRGAGWRLEYDFDAAYGTSRIDAPDLAALQSRLERLPPLRALFATYYNSSSPMGSPAAESWLWYWCGHTALTTDGYAACLAQTHATPAATLQERRP